MKTGQALVMLLVFSAIAIVVITAAVAIIIVGSTSASNVAISYDAFQAAESGVENALLRLLRDPNYSGETLTIGAATTTITVTGTDPKEIVSVGTMEEFVRTIRAEASYTQGVLSLTSWTEEF